MNRWLWWVKAEVENVGVAAPAALQTDWCVRYLAASGVANAPASPGCVCAVIHGALVVPWRKHPISHVSHFLPDSGLARGSIPLLTSVPRTPASSLSRYPIGFRVQDPPDNAAANSWARST